MEDELGKFGPHFETKSEISGAEKAEKVLARMGIMSAQKSFWLRITLSPPLPIISFG